MRLTSLFGLILCFSKLAYAQSDYRPGSIITISRDTVSGYILYTENSSRFESCSFKKEAQGETQVYKPFEIVGYAYDKDKFYISQKIKNNSISEEVFAENLVYGKVSLFRCKDKLYLDANGSLHELSILRVPVNTAYGPYIATKNQYKDTLTTYLHDCSDAVSKINSTSLSEREITKLINRYNNCPPEVKKIIKEGIEFQIGLSGGYTETKLYNLEKLGSNVSMEFTEEFILDKGLFGGLSLTISYPKFSEKLKLGIDIFYQENSHEAFLSKGVYNDILIMSYNSVYTPILINYQLTNLKVIPVFELGIGLRFLLDSEHFWQREEASLGNILIRTGELLEPSNLTCVPIVGLGLNKKINKVDLTFRARYQAGNAPFNTTSEYEFMSDVLKQRNITLTLGALFNISK